MINVPTIQHFSSSTVMVNVVPGSVFTLFKFNSVDDVPVQSGPIAPVGPKGPDGPVGPVGP